MKEAATLLRQLGFRGVPTLGVLVVLFGVLLPWMKGVGFLDQVVLGAYACIGVVFAAPAAARKFDARSAVAGILVCVFYGELMSVLLLLAGIATVYATHWGRIFVGPNLESLARCAGLGLSMSLAVSTMAAWMAERFSAEVARRLVRVVFLAMLAAFYLRSGWLPDVAVRGAWIALGVAAVAILLLRARIRADERK